MSIRLTERLVQGLPYILLLGLVSAVLWLYQSNKNLRVELKYSTQAVQSLEARISRITNDSIKLAELYQTVQDRVNLVYVRASEIESSLLELSNSNDPVINDWFNTKIPSNVKATLNQLKEAEYVESK